MTHAISALLSCHQNFCAGLLSSVASSNHQGECRVLLEKNCALLSLSCSAAAARRGHGRWVPGMAVACKRSAGVPCFACAAQQSLWHCLEACHALGRVRRDIECRAAESRLSARLRGGSKLGLAKTMKRSSKTLVSRREEPKTGQLVVVL